MKISKVVDEKTKKPRYVFDLTEKEFKELYQLYYIACRENIPCFGENEEIDKEILFLRKWGKRFGWTCPC